VGRSGDLTLNFIWNTELKKEKGEGENLTEYLIN